MEDINWLAVVVVVVIHQVLGFLWYGPVFGKKWLAAIGKQPEEISGSGAAYAVAILCSLVAAVALTFLLARLDVNDALTGLEWGLGVGVAFVATTVLTASVFQDSNDTVTWLYISFQVVSYALMGAILGVWK